MRAPAVGVRLIAASCGRLEFAPSVTAMPEDDVHRWDLRVAPAEHTS